MAKIQQRYGKNITKFKVTIIMVKNDKIQLKIWQQYSKNTMKIQQKYSCPIYGKNMVEIQQKSGKSLANLWQTYSKNTVNFGQFMAKIWFNSN